MAKETASRQIEQGPGEVSNKSVGPSVPDEVLQASTSAPAAASTYNTFVQISTSTGAIPPPAVVAYYEQILSGSGQRIFAMAEKEQAFRHSMAERAMTANVQDVKEDRKERRRGQFCGLAIAAIGIIVSAVVVWLVPNASGATVGAVIGGSTLTGLVATFIMGRRAKKMSESSSMPPRAWQ